MSELKDTQLVLIAQCGGWNPHTSESVSEWQRLCILLSLLNVSLLLRIHTIRVSVHSYVNHMQQWINTTVLLTLISWLNIRVQCSIIEKQNKTKPSGDACKWKKFRAGLKVSDTVHLDLVPSKAPKNPQLLGSRHQPLLKSPFLSRILQSKPALLELRCPYNPPCFSPPDWHCLTRRQRLHASSSNKNKRDKLIWANGKQTQEFSAIFFLSGSDVLILTEACWGVYDH